MDRALECEELRLSIGRVHSRQKRRDHGSPSTRVWRKNTSQNAIRAIHCACRLALPHGIAMHTEAGCCAAPPVRLVDVPTQEYST